MAKVRVFTLPGGNVAIMAPNEKGRAPQESYDEFFDRVCAANTIIAPNLVGQPFEDVNFDSVNAMSREFRGAWEKPAGAPIAVNMPKAREIHAIRMAQAKTTETARLVLAEVKLRLLGKTTEADQAATDKAAVDGLNLTTLAAQMAVAPNPTALSAIWPALLPRLPV